MIRPDYAGGSIANLMRTLADACGAGGLPQPPLAPRYRLETKTLARARNLVLFVVDGLGARLLADYGSGALRAHAGATLTSVFPSTTAAAIPTFMTGLPPAQHALTGWHMWLDELQAVTAILPLTPRTGKPFAETPAQLTAKLFDHRPLYAAMHRPAWVISPREIAFSPFNAFHSHGADTLAYADLDGLMQTLAGLVRVPGRKFVYAYWPLLDSVAHRFGTDSKEARATLAAFCTAFDALQAELAGSDTTLLVTADHGFIDSPERRIVQLDEHPELAALLARPLCGEQRVAWCYLKPGAGDDFRHYVASRLAESADAVPCAQLLADGWFGPGPAHPRLASRIGDYALVMRDNWTIKDWLPGERRHTLIGVHGGVSADEMEVPLVALHC
ncbi:alkaline phosphatase family protein [Azospira restricta]|uniref:Alkaline phosphatase family protein n=1 Tax=Azospira restricta TaxID=404405 RepID=A0A974Y4K7_9RHOO|nr:alkaline phosphatase family protein [Azospira restricta]QRJ64506.1 alkaline phosphatase family protein [Azospira restricta]